MAKTAAAGGPARAAAPDAAPEPARAFDALEEGLLIVDLDGKARRLTRAAAALVGRTIEEAASEACCNLIHGGLDRPPSCPLVRLLQTRAPAEAIYPIGERWIRERAHPIFDDAGRLVGAVLSLSDTTETKLAEDALRESERRFREIYENSSDCIFLVDVAPDGRFRIAGLNPAEERSIGMSSSEVQGRLIDEVVPPDVAEQVIANYRRCVESRTIVAYDERLDLPAGRRYYHTTLIPIRRFNGHVYRLVGVARDVTQHRQAEEALRTSEGRYRSLFEHSVTGVYRTTLDGRVLEVNEAFARMLGYSSPEEVRERGSVELYLRPEDRESLVAALKANGAVRGLEAELRRRDGTRLSVIENAVLLPDDSGASSIIEGTLIDMSERRHLEAEMRRAAAALDQAAETVIITDTQGAIEYVNPAFTRVSGFSREEALGRSPRILKSGKHTLEFYKDLWGTLRRGETWHGRLINKRKDGSLFEEDALISPVRDETGRIAHYVAVNRDVTQEVALERQLAQAQKMEAVGRLAGGIAHDFNNLLQAMLSHTQLLRTAPQRVGSELAELEAQIHRGAALTRQLLLFSRQEDGRREFIDLNELVSSSGGFLRRLVRENIELNIETSGEHVVVEADRGQLDQVLMNLAVNAADAMPSGGRLTIRTGAAGPMAWFAVSDTGHGIPEEIREKVFEPFFTTKPRGEGSGLGLSVVHGIVSRHAGRIDAESAVGQGTTFRVLLPRSLSGEYPRVVLEHANRTLPGGRGERVLVVEDEEMTRNGLTELLSTLGYDVAAVGTGADAGRLPNEPPFDVILTDLMLPDVDGRALARGLRDRWPSMQVILMSGYTEDAMSADTAGLGDVRFLEKPFDMAALAKLLRETLDRG